MSPRNLKLKKNWENSPEGEAPGPNNEGLLEPY